MLVEVQGAQPRHLPRAEHHETLLAQVAEDLAGERDRRVGERDRALREPGVGANALADGEGTVDKTSITLPVPRASLAALYASLTWPRISGCANDQRIESGRDPEQVASGVGVGAHIQGAVDVVTTHPAVVRETGDDTVADLGGIGGHRVHLGPIARRQQHGVVAAILRETVERAGTMERLTPISLAHFEWRGVVTEADQDEMHHAKLWLRAKKYATGRKFRSTRAKPTAESHAECRAVRPAHRRVANRTP